MNFARQSTAFVNTGSRQVGRQEAVQSNTFVCRELTGRREKRCLLLRIFSFVEIAIRHIAGAIVHVRVSAFSRDEGGEVEQSI